MERIADCKRTTKETDIALTLNLDGSGKADIDTGIGFFDHMLDGFSRHGMFDLNVRVKGDLIVDCHHTIEDTGIVLGTAIKEAVGDKKGMKRFGSCILPMDETLVLCAVDLSGRPYLSFDGEFTTDRVGYMDTEMVKEFFDMLKNDKDQGWFNGFTFYQFRDRGRLGLEIEDPNNADCGIEQPVMQTYKEIIHDEYFYPEMKSEGDAQFPVKLRWGGSEDAEGIEIPLHFEKNPTFCEITFEDEDAELNLMMEINGKWFYKAPHAKTIDFMSAFFEKPLESEADMTLKIFAPPASGENVNDGSEDWMLNTYSTITKMPNIRIRFAPILK